MAKCKVLVPLYNRRGVFRKVDGKELDSVEFGNSYEDLLKRGFLEEVKGGKAKADAEAKAKAEAEAKAKAEAEAKAKAEAEKK